MSGARVGFMGLGIMGSRMAANLASAGFPLTVWTHTPGKAERWADEHGSRFAATGAELAAESDIVVTMVVDGPQVSNLLLGPNGVARGAAPGTLCVDMSTIAPSEAVQIGAGLAEHALGFVDAPVTGSAPRAQNGTLTIMAGGVKSDFERALPLFETMGEAIVHVGALGKSQSVKLINNALAAANASALAQALVLAEAEHLDPEALLEVLAAGSGASAMLTLKAQPMLARDYTTLFKTDHMVKDVRLCLQEAARAGVAFPAAQHALELLEAASGEGRGGEDFASLREPASRLEP